MLHIIIGEGLSSWFFCCHLWKWMSINTCNGVANSGRNGANNESPTNGQDRMEPTMVNSPTMDRTEWSQQRSPKMDRLEHTCTHMPTDSNDTNQYTQWAPPPLRQ